MFAQLEEIQTMVSEHPFKYLYKKQLCYGSRCLAASIGNYRATLWEEGLQLVHNAAIWLLIDSHPEYFALAACRDKVISRASF